jgi:phosphinothricin acetyltransferase
MSVRIEPASVAHVPEVAAIYDDAARTSGATFDHEGSPESAWREQVAQTDPMAGRLLLVALAAGGEVLGYAKSGEHKSRPAYASTCETSVYVAREARGRGVGGALYDALLERLDESPLRLAVGGVAEPNEASTRLHLSRGYTPVGTFTGIGVKRGREWDVTWFERRLAEPALVRELRAVVAGGGDAEAAVRAIRRRCGYRSVSVDGAVGGAGAPAAPAVAILDPRDATQLGTIAIEADAPPGAGERLLLDWCAEVLAPLLAREP